MAGSNWMELEKPAPCGWFHMLCMIYQHKLPLGQLGRRCLVTPLTPCLICALRLVKVHLGCTEMEQHGATQSIDTGLNTHIYIYMYIYICIYLYLYMRIYINIHISLLIFLTGSLELKISLPNVSSEDVCRATVCRCGTYWSSSLYSHW